MNQYRRLFLVICLSQLFLIVCAYAEEGVPSVMGATDPDGTGKALADTLGSSGSLIVIDKANRILSYFEDGQEVLEFPVAFGSRPGQKRRRGDRRTPEGEYRIAAKNGSSKYHKFLWLNYPNRDDARRGLKASLISQRDYEAIVRAVESHTIPPQQTRLGGYIGIHGGKAVRVFRKILFLDDDYDWTFGCIALKNGNLDRLYERVKVGTRVVIK